MVRAYGTRPELVASLFSTWHWFCSPSWCTAQGKSSIWTCVYITRQQCEQRHIRALNSLLFRLRNATAFRLDAGALCPGVFSLCVPIKSIRYARGYKQLTSPLNRVINACLKPSPTLRRGAICATSRSSHTLTTVRPPWSTPCSSRPTPSLPMVRLRTVSWTPVTWSAKRASPSSRRTPRLPTTARRPTARPSPSTSSTPPPATPTSVAR